MLLILFGCGVCAAVEMDIYILGRLVCSPVLMAFPFIVAGLARMTRWLVRAPLATGLLGDDAARSDHELNAAMVYW